MDLPLVRPGARREDWRRTAWRRLGLVSIFPVQDPQWDWTTLTRRDLKDAFNSPSSNTARSSVTKSRSHALRDRGGKVIIFHGMADSTIPVFVASTITAVQQRMGGEEKTAQFARLFLAPVSRQFAGTGSGATAPSKDPRLVRRQGPEVLIAEWLTQTARSSPGARCFVSQRG